MHLFHKIYFLFFYFIQMNNYVVMIYRFSQNLHLLNSNGGCFLSHYHSQFLLVSVWIILDQFGSSPETVVTGMVNKILKAIPRMNNEIYI